MRRRKKTGKQEEAKPSLWELLIGENGAELAAVAVESFIWQLSEDCFSFLAG
jgi:hypothetical protein